MIGALAPFGKNAYAVWVFAGGILVFFLVMAIVLMGVSFIKGLLDQASGRR